mmetsp:Transcript_8455/g.18565  ORF Transcript_8455/g.18565 Transcript_8455/m.18565 type:complete len:520 (-) Transcript_8455:568-2127(-)
MWQRCPCTVAFSLPVLLTILSGFFVHSELLPVSHIEVSPDGSIGDTVSVDELLQREEYDGMYDIDGYPTGDKSSELSKGIEEIFEKFPDDSNDNAYHDDDDEDSYNDDYNNDDDNNDDDSDDDEFEERPFGEKSGSVHIPVHFDEDGNFMTMVNPNPKPITPPPFKYGVDISYPMQSRRVSVNYNGMHTGNPGIEAETKDFSDSFIDALPRDVSLQPPQPLGNRQSFYEDYMQGCRDFYNKEGRFSEEEEDVVENTLRDKSRGVACDSVEYDRVVMSAAQPKSVMNFTDIGFKKMKAPPVLFQLLKDFWQNNFNNQKPENWFEGNVYTNHWDAPTYMVSLDDESLIGQAGLKNKIWDATREAIEEWTGQRLHPVSLYGIRIYPDSAVLAPHVDRLPLVSSAIINVAQDVDEDWPIEVCGHDGTMYNVTMEPGDLVLYESHSVLHGRPFPLKGRFYANVFIHFEPLGNDIRQATKVVQKEDGSITEETYDFEVPKYIIPGTEAERKWKDVSSLNRNFLLW